MGHPNILIIGREPSIAVTIQSILENGSDAISFVEDLRSAESLLREHTFDVAIIHESAAALRDIDLDALVDREGIRVPCIWVAAEPTLDHALQATNKGMFSYVPQPLSESNFEDHVRSAIAQTQLERLIVSAEKRAMDVTKRQQRIRAASSNKALSLSDAVINSFLELIFERVIDAYLDAQQFFFILTQRNPTALAQNIRQDPVKRRLVGVIEKGVEVLWGTRNQFKSKQLANLRKDFEGVLEEVDSE